MDHNTREDHSAVCYDEINLAAMTNCESDDSIEKYNDTQTIGKLLNDRTIHTSSFCVVGYN